MLAKFVLSFLLIIIIFGAALYIEYYYTHQVMDMEEEIIEMNNFQEQLLNLAIEHLVWMTSLYEMMVGGEAPTLGDHTECNLGQWYYDITPEDYFREPYEAMEEPHTHLHSHGKEVVELYTSGNEDEALRVFNEEIKPDLALVQENLKEIINLTNA